MVDFLGGCSSTQSAYRIQPKCLGETECDKPPIFEPCVQVSMPFGESVETRAAATCTIAFPFGGLHSSLYSHARPICSLAVIRWPYSFILVYVGDDTVIILWPELWFPRAWPNFLSVVSMVQKGIVKSGPSPPCFPCFSWGQEQPAADIFRFSLEIFMMRFLLRSHRRTRMGFHWLSSRPYSCVIWVPVVALR